MRDVATWERTWRTQEADRDERGDREEQAQDDQDRTDRVSSRSSPTDGAPGRPGSGRYAASQRFTGRCGPRAHTRAPSAASRAATANRPTAGFIVSSPECRARRRPGPERPPNSSRRSPGQRPAPDRFAPRRPRPTRSPGHTRAPECPIERRRHELVFEGEQVAMTWREPPAAKGLPRHRLERADRRSSACRPNTVRYAELSPRSFAGTPAPWAVHVVDGVRFAAEPPEGRRRTAISSDAPVSAPRAVQPSLPLPKPSTSAYIRAPRARACSSSSSRNAPAASPKTVPSASASNGRSAWAGRPGPPREQTEGGPGGVDAARERGVARPGQHGHDSPRPDLLARPLDHVDPRAHPEPSVIVGPRTSSSTATWFVSACPDAIEHG